MLPERNSRSASFVLSVLLMNSSMTGHEFNSGLYTVLINRWIWSARGWMSTVW